MILLIDATQPVAGITVLILKIVASSPDTNFCGRNRPGRQIGFPGTEAAIERSGSALKSTLSAASNLGSVLGSALAQ